MYRSSMVLFLLALLLSGCSSTQPPKETWPPEWFTTPPLDPNFIVVTAMGESKNNQTAYEKAEEAANASIASTMELRVNGLSERFIESLEVEDQEDYTDLFKRVGKNVISTVLYGAMVEKKAQRYLEAENKYEVCILKTMPLGALQNEFKAQLHNDKVLYAKFKETQAMQELDDEVQKFEEWKDKRNDDMRMLPESGQISR